MTPRLQLFITLLLHFGAGISDGLIILHHRAGDDIILPSDVDSSHYQCSGVECIYNYDVEKYIVHNGTIVKTSPGADRMSLSSNCSLIINKITAEDAGFYNCRNDYDFDYGSTLVYLNVLTAGISGDIVLHRRAGDDVVLPCHIKSSDDCSNLDWIHNDTQNADEHFKVRYGYIEEESPGADRMILSSDCSLIIISITAEDAGLYTCRDGYGDSTHVFLNVLTGEL
ncbi:uncharacterized protein LOC133418370 isoform X2 [Cololabis saira]|uniref:uncharacterized protein LOC133418370 isoform X2 n=1 Tax=Cololabis saira TaxID=129043 RepID=UPI002AD30204|nr:uncharacterized protein LOC133418370 isoform X2 [Cololabis saira]